MRRRACKWVAHFFQYAIKWWSCDRTPRSSLFSSPNPKAEKEKANKRTTSFYPSRPCVTQILLTCCSSFVLLLCKHENPLKPPSSFSSPGQNTPINGVELPISKFNGRHSISNAMSTPALSGVSTIRSCTPWNSLYFEPLFSDFYFRVFSCNFENWPLKWINLFHVYLLKGTSFYSGFTRLCKGLAVVLIGGHIVVQLFPSAINYLALIPARYPSPAALESYSGALIRKLIKFTRCIWDLLFAGLLMCCFKWEYELE